MNKLKLHNFSAIFCAVLVLISIFLAGWNDPEISTFGEKLILFSFGLYLPFYCLRSFHLGEIFIPGSGSTVSKENEALMFWLSILLILWLSIVFLSVPFI